MMDRERKPGRSAALAGLVLLALPVLYFLSVGPARLAFKRGWFSQETGTAIYWPLERFYDSMPPAVQRPMDWYADLWADP